MHCHAAVDLFLQCTRVWLNLRKISLALVVRHYILSLKSVIQNSCTALIFSSSISLSGQIFFVDDS